MKRETKNLEKEESRTKVKRKKNISSGKTE